MALYGEQRDISLIRHINRELLRNIISQQVIYYKCDILQTKVNIYGETTGDRVYREPMQLYALIERPENTAPIEEGMVNFAWPRVIRFLRDDLVDIELVPEIGDIVMWSEGYWEIDNVRNNQLFVGKDPDYPYQDSTGENTMEPELQKFGYAVSIICEAHYVPSDRINIRKNRL
jgi:hypothetical protein